MQDFQVEWHCPVCEEFGQLTIAEDEGPASIVSKAIEEHARQNPRCSHVPEVIPLD